MPFNIVCIPCPKCGRLMMVEPPHKDLYVGMECIAVVCPSFPKEHHWEQIRRIPSMIFQRDERIKDAPRGIRPEVLKEIQRDIGIAYLAGVTVKDIAERFKICTTTVYKYLAKMGIKCDRTAPITDWPQVEHESSV